MLIINADDWGRSPAETDAALQCFGNGRITSTSAMVFMADSERGADLARASKINAGLHLNFDEAFTGRNVPTSLRDRHQKTRTYLSSHKAAQLIYNPGLSRQFEYSYRTQLEEFERLFEVPPSHIDGHHHMHLCANLVWGNIIPAATKIRRTFSFWPGEKGLFNRKYRQVLNWWLGRKYQLPDYFFDLTQCLESAKLDRVVRLACAATVELMTHPVNPFEMDYLISPECQAFLNTVPTGDYSHMPMTAGSKIATGALNS